MTRTATAQKSTRNGLTKSSTDQHWSKRAETVEHDRNVNIQDIFQRELEFEFICPHLNSTTRVLEVGCGNGYSTAVFRKSAGHVDAFDQSESMIARAKSTVGETNNRFFVDNVLAPSTAIAGPYDAVICVRVLINLRNLNEQQTAVQAMSALVKPSGNLILVEGYLDGFRALDKLRSSVNLPPIEPAKINFYSSLDQILPLVAANFEITHEYHLGNYDYLTRVVYPLLVGPDKVTHNTEFHDRLHVLARTFNPDELKPISRIRGFILRRRPG
jgi:ubiquinone/menaquinone biosynthesis C-methylase UbiE